MRGTRDRIADRLTHEANRKGLSAQNLAERATLPEGVVRAYFRGQREINFAELNSLCAALALSPMRLLERNFAKPRLALRRVTAADLSAVGRVEEAFLLIKEHLPKPLQPNIRAPDTNEADPQYLIGTLVPEVERLRAQYPRVEDLLSWLNLPVIPVEGGATSDRTDESVLRHQGPGNPLPLGRQRRCRRRIGSR